MPERLARARTADVVIVGGGIIGSASAWALVREGLRVVVLEKSVPGAEASSAAAGILGAQVEATEDVALGGLLRKSRSLYASWVKALVAATGVDIGFRERGSLRVSFDRRSAADAARAARIQKRPGDRLEVLTPARVRPLEPELSPVAGAVHFRDDAQIDPKALFRALQVAAMAAGVEFRSGSYVKGVALERGRARGVALEDGSVVRARHVVVAAGSWTSLVANVPIPENAVRPARGQIVLLDAGAPLLRRVVVGPRCYLVPRDDGHVLVGSTTEFVGFRREVTAGAVRDLLDAALDLVPRLRDAKIRDAWSSFRPYTDDHRPLLGPTTTPGLVLATGHYRNGILLAPVTAAIVRAVILGKPSPVSLAPFDPGRLTPKG